MGKLYLKCLGQLPNCRVIAAVSRSAEAAPGLRIYSTLEAMLERESLEVVCICTPTDLHASQAAAALGHGVHVICEKPLAFRRQEAEALYSLARAKGVRLFAAQVVRFSQSSRWLRCAVKTGRFGAVCGAYFSRLSTMPRWNSGHWSYDEARSGHVPYDLHIHDLDLMVSLFGPPRAAHSLGTGSKAVPFDEHCWFRYDYPDFTVVSEAAWYIAEIPFFAGWRVNFERALAENHNGVITVYVHGQEPYVMKEETSGAVETGINVPLTDMYQRELHDLMELIQTGADGAILPENEILCVLEILEQLRHTPAER